MHCKDLDGAAALVVAPTLNISSSCFVLEGSVTLWFDKPVRCLISISSGGRTLYARKIDTARYASVCRVVSIMNAALQHAERNKYTQRSSLVMHIR